MRLKREREDNFMEQHLTTLQRSMIPEVVKAPVTRFGASGLAHQTRITVNCN